MKPVNIALIYLGLTAFFVGVFCFSWRVGLILLGALLAIAGGFDTNNSTNGKDTSTPPAQ
jgi:hypothetical protein